MKVTIRHTEVSDVEVSAEVNTYEFCRESEQVAVVLNRLFLALPGLKGPKTATELWEVAR